jgi:hypothetical protein
MLAVVLTGCEKPVHYSDWLRSVRPARHHSIRVSRGIAGILTSTFHCVNVNSARRLWRLRGGMILSGDMRSEMEAMRRRLDEQGQRLQEIESKLERLRNWMMQNVGRGKWM